MVGNVPLSPLLPTGTPLYIQVKHALMNALSKGEWKQGDVIPAERALADRFSVSIGTLRKAIDELAAENILVRHQGRGTFVAAHTRDQHFFRFFRVIRHDGNKTYPVTQLHQLRQLRASEEVQEKLNLGPDSDVFEFVNVLSLHGQKILVDVIAVPEKLFKGLTVELLAERPSTLYSFYQESFGLNVIGTTEHVRAAMAGAREAELLEIEQPHPVLEVRRVAYSFNRQPIEWRISYVNTAAYEYVGQEYE